MKFKVECVKNYNDLQKNKNVFTGETFIVDKKRCDELVNAKVCKVVEEILEDKKENKKKPTKKVVKR